MMDTDFVTHSEFKDLKSEVDFVRSEVGKANTSIAAIHTRMDSQEQSFRSFGNKIDSLALRAAGTEQSRGMVPFSMIIAVLGTMATYGLILWGGIWFAVNSKFSEANLLQQISAKDTVTNEENITNLDDRLREIESTRFSGTQGHELEAKVSTLRENQARDDERYLWLKDLLTEHIGEADHPHQQTHRLNAMEKELDHLEEERRLHR